MTSGAYGARSPRSHYDVILIVTSFATELATPTVTDVRAPYRVQYIKMLPVAVARSFSDDNAIYVVFFRFCG